jgi:hypothetical protein
MDKLTAAVEATLESLYCQWRKTIEETDFAWLTTVINEDDSDTTVRDQVIISARVVEQAFGGITASLWDDPRDWTLPEVLQTREQMLAYFDEVEATRRRGMALITSDADLLKMIVTPSGEMQLLELMVETCSRAIDHYFRAKKILAIVIQQDTRSKLTADVKDRMN